MLWFLAQWTLISRSPSLLAPATPELQRSEGGLLAFLKFAIRALGALYFFQDLGASRSRRISKRLRCRARGLAGSAMMVA